VAKIKRVNISYAKKKTMRKFPNLWYCKLVCLSHTYCD